MLFFARFRGCMPDRLYKGFDDRFAHLEVTIAKSHMELTVAAVLSEFHLERGSPNDCVIADMTGQLDAFGINLAGRCRLRI